MERDKCASQHFGVWAIYPEWFAKALAAVRSGAWTPKVEAAAGKSEQPPELFQMVTDNIARIPIMGQMTKFRSSFGGTSSIQTRQAIRAAASKRAVKQILLHIDSPGGTAAGTRELRDDIKAIDQNKPVTAYIDDLGGSAAYFAATGASRIVINKTGLAGSIGTMAVLTDTSKADERMGFEHKVISSGPKKGLGADGKITPELEAETQKIVDMFAQDFFNAVSEGRNLSGDKLQSVIDGSIFTAGEALANGLVDQIQGLEATVAQMQSEIDAREKAIARAKRVAAEIRQRKIS